MLLRFKTVSCHAGQMSGPRGIMAVKISDLTAQGLEPWSCKNKPVVMEEASGLKWSDS